MTSASGLPPIRLRAEPLTSDDFAPFGQVLGPGIGASRLIRDNTVRLTNTPSCLTHTDAATRAEIDIYEVTGKASPVVCTRIERHPLSAQMFVPQMSVSSAHACWMVAVWPDGPEGPVRAFVARAGQGVVYKRGIWHQGIIALEIDMQFVSMMFRGDDTQDTEFHTLSRAVAFEIGDP
ncbi:ureidoglycolate lyase [Rhodophyticola sp. CCM32]|uniref:ureidoglycolate lyase n=1 Tax=Rhodophyticola sp. CCM32 TaxID=2916397 RepID=UPI00143DFAB1|nr:ureidoglycolate lyase [Rhodophyticola sp. CCM32]